jgi:hypothetical protein
MATGDVSFPERALLEREPAAGAPTLPRDVMVHHKGDVKIRAAEDRITSTGFRYS